MPTLLTDAEAADAVTTLGCLTRQLLLPPPPPLPRKSPLPAGLPSPSQGAGGMGAQAARALGGEAMKGCAGPRADCLGHGGRGGRGHRRVLAHAHTHTHKQQPDPASPPALRPFVGAAALRRQEAGGRAPGAQAGRSPRGLETPPPACPASQGRVGQSTATPPHPGSHRPERGTWLLGGGVGSEHARRLGQDLDTELVPPGGEGRADGRTPVRRRLPRMNSTAEHAYTGGPESPPWGGG